MNALADDLSEQSAEQIMARVENELSAAIACGKDPRTLVLATDADGTLWDGDIGIDVFETLLKSGAVRDAAREGLAAEARFAGKDDSGSAPVLLERLYKAYLDDSYAHDRAFAMMAWAFAGYRE